jgi:esterase/lipase superfamily enzyme
MHYMLTARRRKGKAYGNEPGKTRFLRVPGQSREPKRSHECERDRWVREVLEASKNGASPGDAHPEGDVLFFVHGYNNAPDAVLARQRQLCADLEEIGFDGVVVAFDWPSSDKALNYLEDRSDARQTALRLVQDGIRLFAVQQARGCAVNVHVLAHSTGAFVVREAFDDADDSAMIANVNWTVSQMVFISADVSRRSLAHDDSKSSSIYRHCVRLTNYSNPFDKVLKLSNIKRVGVAPRAGRVGLPDDASGKAVDVFCGKHWSGLDERDDALGQWSHSWQIGDPLFTEDLLYTLRGDIDRHHLPTRHIDERGRLALGWAPAG